MDFIRYKIELKREVPIGRGPELQSAVVNAAGPMIYGNPLWESVSMTIDRVTPYLYRYTTVSYVKVPKDIADKERAELEKMGCVVKEVPLT